MLKLSAISSFIVLIAGIGTNSHHQVLPLIIMTASGMQELGLGRGRLTFAVMGNIGKKRRMKYEHEL